jgi:predicted  nucleic acid-binding Zn-ribbon protein
MEPNKDLTPALGEAKKRRQTLHDAIVHLEMAISSPAAGRAPEWSAQVAKNLIGVRDAFEQHVLVTEKPGGLYEEIRERAPRLTGTVERLQDEHPTITESVAALVEKLDAGEVETDAWPPDNARNDLQRMIGAVVRHRQKGADLVWEAYNVDIGGME